MSGVSVKRIGRVLAAASIAYLLAACAPVSPPTALQKAQTQFASDVARRLAIKARSPATGVSVAPEPGSTKAKLLDAAIQRIRNDPVTARVVREQPRYANLRFGGLRRVTPAERQRVGELIERVMNGVPKDCGGLTTPRAIFDRYMSPRYLSDADYQTYLDIHYEALRAEGLQIAPSIVSAEQSAQAKEVVVGVVNAMIKADPQNARAIAMIQLQRAGFKPPPDWCDGLRVYWRAVMQTPQPYRDWTILTIAPADPAPPAAPPSDPVPSYDGVVLGANAIRRSGV